MSAKNNSESEYYGGDLVITCRQKIIVKVNIMGEILSRDVTLLTCRQKIIVKVNIMGEKSVTFYSGLFPLIIARVNTKVWSH